MTEVLKKTSTFSPLKWLTRNPVHNIYFTWVAPPTSLAWRNIENSLILCPEKFQQRQSLWPRLVRSPPLSAAQCTRPPRWRWFQQAVRPRSVDRKGADRLGDLLQPQCYIYFNTTCSCWILLYNSHFDLTRKIIFRMAYPRPDECSSPLVHIGYFAVEVKTEFPYRHNPRLRAARECCPAWD